MSKLKYFDGTNWNDVGGNITGDTLPIGAIIPYGSATAPTNWLVCDGSAVSRTTYAELFAVIGTTFGSGDGSTTFNLPNLKGKVAVGQDTSDTDFDTIGETGGNKTQTITLSNLPNEVRYPKYSSSETWALQEQSNGHYPLQDGGNTPINVLQPYQVVCYIIKAKQSAGLVANVSNTYSTSENDTYSCDYANDNFGINQYNNVEDGYVKFPNGLMIQWGVESVSRTATQQQEVTINFPQSFNTAFTAVASINDPGYGYGALNEVVGVVQLSNASFSCLFKCINTPSAHDLAVRWIAIGKWK